MCFFWAKLSSQHNGKHGASIVNTGEDASRDPENHELVLVERPLGTNVWSLGKKQYINSLWCSWKGKWLGSFQAEDSGYCISVILPSDVC